MTSFEPLVIGTYFAILVHPANELAWISPAFFLN
jgi:hypothetical protein